MADLEETPPYTWNPLSRFCDCAPDYAKYRPSYPAAAIDILLEGMETQFPIVADVGAGTGISSRLLAKRGVRVIAIEPNAAPMSSLPNQNLTVETFCGRINLPWCLLHS